MQNTSINLCMIVKDEAHIIERCLHSVKPLIDKVLIVDTGSSDNTIEVNNIACPASRILILIAA